VDWLTGRGVPVAIAAGSNDRSVAEQAIMFVLALAKRAPAMDRWVRQGGWERRLDAESRDVEGRTLLVVGYGRIGRRVAAMARALDMKPIAYDPMLPAEARAAAPDPVIDDLAAALAQADYVSLHVPRHETTLGLFDAAAFAAMKPGAVLVNCARGGVVDEPAMLAALDDGRLAGAGIDVFATEPPAPDDPILAHDKVLLSPHAAALTEEGAIRMGRLTALNVLAAREGTLEPGLLANPGVLAP
jgi:D-3-phosphoglycerate dehydrogenase